MEDAFSQSSDALIKGRMGTEGGQPWGRAAMSWSGDGGEGGTVLQDLFEWF